MLRYVCAVTALAMAAGGGITGGTARAEDNTGTGGTILYLDAGGSNPTNTPHSDGYVAHIFTNAGGDALFVPVDVSADVLVVGGGGGGGSNGGGGGGAGGVIFSNAVPLAGGSNYAVQVGAGGPPHPNDASTPVNGGHSVFGALTAIGGGGGASRDNGGAPAAGGSGGGGAGAMASARTVAGAGVAGQGFAGGNGVWPDLGVNSTGGGGGGAGSAGTAGANQVAGNGGTGVYVEAFAAVAGSPAGWFAGGGGGGRVVNGSNGTGGDGGGGAGGGAPGAPNTGGGGGGGGAGGAGAAAGGSGIVIVRYPYDRGALSIRLLTPTNDQAFGSTVSISARLRVSSGTPPYAVTLYTNSAEVWTTNNATDTSYTVALGVLPVGAYELWATVTDSDLATAFSATNTFTVQNDTAPPTPNPMTFAAAPVSIGGGALVLTATTATDALTPPVAYWFENTTNNDNSGWIAEMVWTNTGLTPLAAYGYRVKARDSATPPNETEWSEEAVALASWPPTNLYWDGGAADIAGNGDGASAGGAGTWNTTLRNWDLGSGKAHVAWANGNGDTAVFGGTAGTVTLGADIVAGGLTFTTANYVLTGNNLTFGAPGVISNAAAVTIASALAGSEPLTKEGAGVLSLSGANGGFSGELILKGGQLAGANASTLGAGATLTFAGSSALTPQYGQNPTFAKGVTVNPGVTATMNILNFYYNMSFTGPLAGSGTLVASSYDSGGGARVTFANANNTFTGTLVLGNIKETVNVNSFADSPNPIQISATVGSGGVFALAAGPAAPLVFNQRQILLVGSAVAEIDNNNGTIENTITINTDLAFSGSGSKVLTFGGSHPGANRFAGAIGDGAGGTLRLVKSGAGRWALSGTNTYSGPTAIQGGVLEIGGGGCLGGGVYAGSITNAGALHWNSSADQTLSGTLSGAGALIKDGAGALTLTGTNAYAGLTTVNAGTLRLGADHTLGTSNNVVLAGGALDMSGFNNTLGTLKVEGDGALLTGGGTLAFRDSSGVSWTGTLEVVGSLGSQTLRFGTSSNALTSAQVEQIVSQGYPVFLDADGYVRSQRLSGALLQVR